MARNQITDFLNTKLIDNKFIFINVWTIVHLITGFLLMKYFLNYLSHLFLLLVFLILVSSRSAFIMELVSNLLTIASSLPKAKARGLAKKSHQVKVITCLKNPSNFHNSKIKIYPVKSKNILYFIKYYL